MADHEKIPSQLYTVSKLWQILDLLLRILQVPNRPAGFGLPLAVGQQTLPQHFPQETCGLILSDLGGLAA
jgi:hypothetical protein